MSQPVSEILERLQREPIVRTFAIDREAVDEESRTVNLAFASDRAIDHWFGSLCLSMKKGAMRTERLESGAPLLMDHNTRDVVGVVENFTLDKDGIARADVRFGESARAQEVFHDVKTGIRRNVSVGFMVHEMHLEKSEKKKGDTYRSDDWEPFEISLVAVPADISVGVGRAANFLPLNFQNPSPTERDISRSKEETQMTPEEIAAAAAAEAARSVETTQHQASPQLAVIREINDFATQLGGQAPAVAETYRLQDGATVSGFLAAVRAAEQATRANQPTVPVMDPHTAAARNGAPQQNVQLARSVRRFGALKSFSGEGAEERAYRFGQFLLAGPIGNAKAREWCAANGLRVTRAQSESVNEKGGYLVPEEFGNDLIDLIEKYGVFRKYADIVPMSSDTRSDPRIAGELEAFFTGESTEGTESDFEVDRVSLTAKKLMVLVPYSSEVSEDAAISMGDKLAMLSARAFAKKEDNCGFNGDGTSTYGGIVGAREKLLGLSATRANIAGLQVASGNLFSEFVLGDFRGTVARLPEYADPDAAWYVHRTFYWNVMVAALLAANGVTASEVEEARKQMFLGYPVRFSQVMPKADANDQVCALFGDLALAASLGDRSQFTISISEHVRFAEDDFMFKARQRVDINVHDVGNQSATAADREAGPIVGLASAAS